MNTAKPDIRRMTFEELLEKDGYFLFTNTGVSMMPLLRQQKDIVEIRRKKAGRCRKYDVVLYRRKDQYILHRILKVLPSGYLIAGDNCVSVETDIKDENILGVMTRVVRNGKTITPDQIGYKCYVHLWCDVYPLRMWILKAIPRIFHLLSVMKKRWTGS